MIAPVARLQLALAVLTVSAALAGVLGAACDGGCGRVQEAPGSGAPATPAAEPEALVPPLVAFVAPQPWTSRGEPPVSVPPPDLRAETWRVLVTQTKPLQAPTPKWQALPADQNVALAMQPKIRFRCLVTAAEVGSEANDFGTKLKAWVLTRYLRCSGDGWRSWVEYPHKVRIPAPGQPGERETVLTAEALLRERDGAGARETMLMLRDDKEQLEATTGPPRILPGVAVDPD